MLSCFRALRFYGRYVDEFAAVFAFCEEDCAVHKGIERVVFADAYVEAGVVGCAALTFDDVAGLGELTTKNFNTESFAFGLAARLLTNNPFLIWQF